jgi:hypothetical protein
MQTWDGEKLLQWIHQRNPILLQGDNLKTFQEENINGMALLSMTREDLKECGLSIAARASLKSLADEVKDGKIIPFR